MRKSEPPAHYLVGTRKPHGARAPAASESVEAGAADVRVKLLAHDAELHVFAESRDRIAKERSMRRRRMKWLWERRNQLSTMKLSRDALLIKLRSAPRRTRPPPLGGFRRGRCVLRLLAQPQAAARGAPARRPLSAARDPERVRSRAALGILPTAGRRRGVFKTLRGNLFTRPIYQSRSRIRLGRDGSDRIPKTEGCAEVHRVIGITISPGLTPTSLFFALTPSLPL